MNDSCDSAFTMGICVGILVMQGIFVIFQSLTSRDIVVRHYHYNEDDESFVDEDTLSSEESSDSQNTESEDPIDDNTSISSKISISTESIGFVGSFGKNPILSDEEIESMANY